MERLAFRALATPTARPHTQQFHLCYHRPLRRDEGLEEGKDQRRRHRYAGGSGATGKDTGERATVMMEDREARLVSYSTN